MAIEPRTRAGNPGGTLWESRRPSADIVLYLITQKFPKQPAVFDQVLAPDEALRITDQRRWEYPDHPECWMHGTVTHEGQELYWSLTPIAEKHARLLVTGWRSNA